MRTTVSVALCAAGCLAGALAVARAAPPDADGTPPAADSAAPSSGPTHIAARSGFVAIYAAPRPDAARIGMFRAGQVVPLRAPARATGPDVGPCAEGWYALEPRGFVCPSERTTFARDDARVAAARELLPPPGAAYPYHYGLSRGAARYYRIPTAAEQRATEWGLDARLAGLPAPSGPPPTPALARYFAERAASEATLHLPHTGPLAPPGAKLAWSTELVAEGRVFVVTSELELVPRDELEELPRVGGAGTSSPELPFALSVAAGPRFALAADAVPVPGAMRESGRFERRELLPLAAPPALVGPFVALADGGFARASDLGIFVTRPRPPDVGPAERWLHVGVNAGTLVAYEGDRPVYAALASPGRSGAAPDAEFGTPPGRYRIAQKWLTGDMSGRLNGGGWRTREVPFVAYYDGSYAVHGAFWHDVFGRPRSHGCINLTPADASALFGWLEPALPSEWYAVASDASHAGTTLLVTR
ncbi:MAG: L,D-transpeptidase [Myxococcales bacterium]|nr:L,D-transpeptidase [Myxococcales bacterium]